MYRVIVLMMLMVSPVFSQDAIWVYSDPWYNAYNSKAHTFVAGQGTLYSDNLQGLEDHIGAVKVVDGYIATLYKDRHDGSDRISVIGDHPVLWRMFESWNWHNWKKGDGVSLIVVEKGDSYKVENSVQVWWDGTDPWKFSRVPIGTWNAATNWGSNSNSTVAKYTFFPNDALDRIVVPQGIECIVYKDGTSGTYITLGQGDHNLFAKGIGDQATILTVQKLGYHRVSITYLPTGNISRDLVFTSEDHGCNYSSEPQELESNFSESFSQESTVSFDISASISLTQTVEYGGDASPVSGSTAVEVSTSMSAGKSTSKSRTVQVSETSHATIPVQKCLRSLFHVYKVAGDTPFIETLSDKNGRQIQVKGMLKASLRYDSDVEHHPYPLPK